MRHLKARGAVFGGVAGWERANWFAREDQEREYRYSWKRQNWFDNQREEHLAVRNGVGLFDMTSFGKIRVEAATPAFLQGSAPTTWMWRRARSSTRRCSTSAAASRRPHRLALSERPSSSCLGDAAARPRLAAQASAGRVRGHHRCHRGGNRALPDGPGSQKLIRRSARTISPTKPIRSGRFRRSRSAWPGRAHRVTYVGELGWELYVSTDQAAHVFEAIDEAGADVGLKLCGLHTLDSCRIEKAFRHFGHDITDEDNVLEAGLGFAVKTAKGDFIGRDAVLRKKESGLNRRLVQFRLKDPQPLLFHNEAILRDGKIVGPITSGNYGHHLGGAIGLGYVPCQGESEADAGVVTRSRSPASVCGGSVAEADV